MKITDEQKEAMAREWAEFIVETGLACSRWYGTGLGWGILVLGFLTPFALILALYWIAQWISAL